MTEDIIAQLSKIRGLKVISRSSVMRYKKRHQTVAEIAAEVGASHVVEGSVRRAASRLRIVAQLIDANVRLALAKRVGHELASLGISDSDPAVARLAETMTGLFGGSR